MGGNWIPQLSSFSCLSPLGRALLHYPKWFTQHSKQQGAGSVHLFSFPVVWFNLTHTTRASYAILPRQGLWPTLPTAVLVGNKAWSLLFCYALRPTLLPAAFGKSQFSLTHAITWHTREGLGFTLLSAAVGEGTASSP